MKKLQKNPTIIGTPTRAINIVLTMILVVAITPTIIGNQSANAIIAHISCSFDAKHTSGFLQFMEVL